MPNYLLKEDGDKLLQENNDKLILDENIVIDLNTPAAAAVVNDTTPTLEFTGTDTQGNDIRYNVQIATTSPISDGSVIDSYSETNQDGNIGTNQTTGLIGQSFTGSGSNIGRADFYLKKNGSPTGTITAQVFAHSGTFGTSSTGTGTVLATSDTVNLSSITTSFTLVSFTFSGANQITLTNGTKYVIVISCSGVTFGANTVDIGTDTTSPTHSGNYAIYDGGWFSDSTIDTIFYVYATANVLLNKVSGTDAGFVNTANGADTDPFTSGQMASYTVQAGDALAYGTYYWRVRAIDPSGLNSYSSWSETRSFTLSASSVNLKDKFFLFFP